MDSQIWYAIFSTIFGGIYGAFRRLGEVCCFKNNRTQTSSYLNVYLEDSLLVVVDDRLILTFFNCYRFVHWECLDHGLNHCLELLMTA